MTAYYKEPIEIPIERRNKLYKFLKDKLAEFGCPDSYLDSTSHTLVQEIIKILHLKMKESQE